MKPNRLHLDTVSNSLLEVLHRLMKLDQLATFRLVGGTNLSMQLGHRISVDIDMFTDAKYDSLDFQAIDTILQASFPLLEMQNGGNRSFGKSYYLGNSKESLVKVDLFYTDAFIYPVVELDGIRMASLEEIAAMKLEVIGHNGRKKDFWDLHELIDTFTLEQMLAFHSERYPYSHTKKLLITKLTDFQFADSDFDPKCLRGKYWELIKLDMEELVVNSK